MLPRRHFLQGLGATLALPLLVPGRRMRAATAAATHSDATAFLTVLADYVERWHLQKDASPQRGTVHEFVVTSRLKGEHLPDVNPGQWGQWVQCVGGDTIHAAAWYAIGMIHAWRATGDERYRRVVLDD